MVPLFVCAVLAPVALGFKIHNCGPKAPNVWFDGYMVPWSTKVAGSQVMDIPGSWEKYCAICAENGINEWKKKNPNGGRTCMWCDKDFTGIYLHNGLDRHQNAAPGTIKCAGGSRAVAEGMRASLDYRYVALVAAGAALTALASVLVCRKRKLDATEADTEGDRTILLG